MNAASDGPVFPGCHPSLVSWKFRLQPNMDGKGMALDKVYAESLAEKLILTLAQSGSLKIAGATTTNDLETVQRVGSRDAAYLTSLYRDLVKGLQS